MNQLERLIQQLEEKTGTPIKTAKFYCGEVFIKEGKFTPVYFIKSGSCRIFLKDQFGGEVILGIFSAGSTLGDVSKLNQTAASANVAAQSDIELYQLENEHFDVLWSVDSDTSKQLYAQMCMRLTNTNENLGKNVNELVKLKMELQEKIDAQVADIQGINNSLKEKNEELKTLVSTRDQFLNMAIHDLRSPLSIIKGYLELLNHQNMSPSSIQHVSQVIEKNTTHMLALVNDLLGISKLNSISMTLEKEEVNMSCLLLDETQGQNIIASQKDIQLHIDIPQQLPHIIGDPRRLTEVFQNLLSNAIKFTERGKHIYVSTKTTPRELVISIKDEGQGIPSHELPKLFKSFERISTKATEGEASTGLGLSIVKKLIELHDGSVHVESEIGKGSTFTVQLPLP
jgi:signal transduction histidine kinase